MRIFCPVRVSSWHPVHLSHRRSYDVQAFKALQEKMQNAACNFALHPQSTVLPAGFRPPLLQVRLQRDKAAQAADFQHQRAQLQANKKAAVKRAQREALAGSEGAAAAKAAAAVASRSLSALERRGKSIFAQAGSTLGTAPAALTAGATKPMMGGWQDYTATAPPGSDLASAAGADAPIATEQHGVAGVLLCPRDLQTGGA